MAMQVKADTNDYMEELKSELQQTNPNSHSGRLLTQEIERIEKGETKGKVSPWIEVHPNHPQPVSVRIRIPVKEHPKFNFVGKLLGPKGNSLKRLQEETGTKMSILGKGSMRDRAKEEEFRKEGGKYAHLNDELHVFVEVFAEITDGYARLAHALSELKKFMEPVSDFSDDIRQQQLEEMQMYMSNGDKPGRGGRGGFRGAPRGRGAAGGPMPAPSSGRGPMGRGASRGGPPSSRGMGRGSMASGRGGMSAGRGRAAPAMQQSYDDYSATDYSSQGYDEGYGSHMGGYAEQEYDQGYGQSDTQYFDYGHGSGSASGYEDYGDSWGTSVGPMKSSVGRGAKSGQYRAHPYGSRGGY